ncbi:MAG: hypothetical protein Q7S84_04110 [bacterium]|nr:hypothetical protein [bacterium]
MKLSTFGKFAAGIVLASAIATPFAVLAQPDPTLTDFSLSGISGISKLGGKIGGWMLGILLVLAVIFILAAAFLYLTSGGDEAKVGKAKSYIIYAIVAVVVGILAKTIITLVQSLVNTAGT